MTVQLYRRQHPFNRRSQSRLMPYLFVLAIVLSLAGLFRSAFHVAHAWSDGEVEMRGVVVSAPLDANGLGNWQVRSDANVIRQVVVDNTTKMEKGVPRLGEQVEVKGLRRQNGVIDATEFIRLVDDQHRDDARIRGHLVSAPANGIGVWLLQTSRTLTQTVIADSNTRLDDGIPAQGAWVVARGSLQGDGSLLATRIRVDGHELQQVVVRLKTGVVSDTIASRYNLTSLSTLLASGNIYLFSTSSNEDEQIITPQIAADADVVWAELNYVNRLPEGNPYKAWRWGGEDPTGFVNQAAFEQVHLGAALATAQGNGVVVAVLDTGIDLTHPALASHLISGWDMVADDAIPQDEGPGFGWGHGTHVAGVIAHIAPASQLLPVRVLDSNGSGNSFTLAYAIEWAAAHGAQVINLSLGVTGNSRVLQDTIHSVIDQGVIVVAAAGNDNTKTLQFPAGYAGVISVTAVDATNHKADFANYGGWVDIAAPGVGITSTLIGPEGSGYASWSGTSMATSFVSGAAALIRAKVATASSPYVEHLLRTSAAGLNNVNPAYQNQLGGLLNIGSAITATTTGTEQNYLSYLPFIKKSR